MLSTRDAKIIKMWTEKYPNPHTRYCYALDSERLLSHAKKPLSRITLGDLQAFAQLLSAAGLAPVSRVRVLAAAKSLFGFCYRMRHIPANPAAELALPRYEVRLVERILSEEDVQRMLAVDAEPRDRVLLHLLYGGGLRVGEVCNLRWRNLRPHGEAGQITVYGKGGRTRSIALPAPLWSDITSLRGSAGAEEPVFPSRSGQALDRGAPIHLVQATLGHSSVATTSAYLHASPGDSSARFLAPLRRRSTRRGRRLQRQRRAARSETNTVDQSTLCHVLGSGLGGALGPMVSLAAKQRLAVQRSERPIGWL